ncbi:MAG: hypothetical protein ACPGO5_02770 [Patescibacteria group bacterium]
MAIFIPDKNIKSNDSFGQAVNKAHLDYINSELKNRKLKGFTVAGVEIILSGKHKVYFDGEVQMSIEFKDKKLKPSDKGKNISLNLHDIKDIKWQDPKLKKNAARILIWRFNNDWWIWDADFKQNKKLEESFKISRSFAVRGGGYMPLSLRRKERPDFISGWKDGLDKELSAMWRRHITVSQRYRGVIVYDGNYFDLFSHAQELYVLGYYYSSIVICRTAAEQALIQILRKSGKGFEIYKRNKGKKKLKSIEQLTTACRSYALFHKKYPINKTAARKANEISVIAGNLVHPKTGLKELDVYKEDALKCMDNLQYIIKNHLNFIKDTGVVSGYKITGSSKRLK